MVRIAVPRLESIPSIPINNTDTIFVPVIPSRRNISAKRMEAQYWIYQWVQPYWYHLSEVHENNSTTTVRIAVATSESVFLIPHFAKTAVIPVKKEEPIE